MKNFKPTGDLEKDLRQLFPHDFQRPRAIWDPGKDRRRDRRAKWIEGTVIGLFIIVMAYAHIAALVELVSWIAR